MEVLEDAEDNVDDPDDLEIIEKKKDEVEKKKEKEPERTPSPSEEITDAVTSSPTPTPTLTVNKVDCPDLVGLTQAKAEKKLKDLNLEVGEVVYQSVPAGDSISEGDTLSVSVSKGQGVTVPYFIGKKKSYAASFASTNDILVTYNEIYSNNEKNTIIDQSIASNSLMGVGDTIVITVSLGKPYIPNYIGEDINELLAWIEEVNSSGCNISLQINEKKYY